jgi:hypothetical protein
MTMYEGLGKTWACPECGEVFVSAISGSTIYLRHAEAPQPTPSYSILEAPQWRIPNMTREKALEQATILGTIFVGRAGINGLSPDEAVEATLIIADKMVAWLEEPTGQAVSTAGP